MLEETGQPYDTAVLPYGPPKRPEFLAYCAAHAERPAKRRAAALDDAAAAADRPAAPA